MGVAPNPPAPVVLTFDLEDWNQLVHRRAGVSDWDKPYPAFRRQVETLLSLLEETNARATFFVLGMTARNYPRVVEEIAARGFEIACHGYDHRPVATLDHNVFRRDVERCATLLEDLCGTRPVGYRAPAFSLTRDAVWAFEVLAALGFHYDSSVYASPRVRRPIRTDVGRPYLLNLPEGGEIWEYPIAALTAGRLRLPIGGGSYWRVLPSRLVVRALDRVAREQEYPVLYFHPYEVDPEPLRAERPDSADRLARLEARYRELWRNTGRTRIEPLIRAAARRFNLVSYAEIHGAVVDRFGTSPRALSADGVVL